MNNAKSVQTVSVTNVNRALYADLAHFCAFNGLRIQTVGRRLMELAVIHPEILGDAIDKVADYQIRPDDVKLQFPNVPRGTITSLVELTRKRKSSMQWALRGLLVWLAEDPDEVLEMIIALEAVPEGTCD